ncbi:MAG: H-NS histone family protein [Rhodocyclaceae bacterium]|nr:H-NS histone family protein [Rhodocyclaceae bacterium]
MRTLAKMSLPELKTLSRRVEAELAARTDSDDLRKRFEAMAAKQGYRLDDVLGEAVEAVPVRKRSGLAGRKLPPKYVHPSNRKLAWSGRGSTPAWVRTWVEHGGSLDALETAAQKLGMKPVGT